jgi:hypothetical protein
MQRRHSHGQSKVTGALPPVTPRSSECANTWIPTISPHFGYSLRAELGLAQVTPRSEGALRSPPGPTTPNTQPHTHQHNLAPGPGPPPPQRPFQAPCDNAPPLRVRGASHPSPMIPLALSGICLATTPPPANLQHAVHATAVRSRIRRLPRPPGCRSTHSERRGHVDRSSANTQAPRERSSPRDRLTCPPLPREPEPCTIGSRLAHPAGRHSAYAATVGSGTTGEYVVRAGHHQWGRRSACSTVVPRCPTLSTDGWPQPPNASQLGEERLEPPHRSDQLRDRLPVLHLRRVLPSLTVRE